MNAFWRRSFTRPTDDLHDTEASLSVPPPLPPRVVDAGREPLSDDDRETLAGCPTVRRFARTTSAADGAFRDSEYASAIDPPTANDRAWRIVDGIVIVALLVVIALLLGGRL